jgi:hypothetical protein
MALNYITRVLGLADGTGTRSPRPGAAQPVAAAHRRQRQRQHRPGAFRMGVDGRGCRTGLVQMLAIGAAIQSDRPV